MPAWLGAALMALVSMLVTAARKYLPSIIMSLFTALGIAIVVNEVAFPALEAMLNSQLGNLPTVLIAYWKATGLHNMTVMIVSALAGRAATKAFMTKLAKQ